MVISTIEIIELLLNSGADVNAKDNGGQTPLHGAARRGSDIPEVRRDTAEIAELLLNNGADVDAKNNEGKTPLHIAEQENTHEAVVVLREHGSN